jgi:hypothetical protein
VTFHIQERIAGAGCGVLSMVRYPVDFVWLARVTDRIEFETTTLTVDCQ